MSQAIDDLVHEHDAILSALKVLGAFEQRLSSGQTVDPADIGADIGNVIDEKGKMLV